MKHSLVSERPVTYMLVFDTGDDVMALLSSFASDKKISGAYISGIGAFSDSKIGYYDLNVLDYKPIDAHEQVEVLSFIGNISLYNEMPKLHAHVILGRSDGSTMGGHLLEAFVKPTLELVLTVLDTPLIRHLDTATQIPLLKL